MKSKIILLATLLFFANSIWAFNFSATSYGKTIYYSTTSNNTCAVIYNSSYSGIIDIPSSVRYQGTSYSVTQIRNAAFFRCTGLTSIIIPSSITSIGDSTFLGCTSLDSVVFPNTITNIGKEAFAGCYSLTTITLPNSVTSIGRHAFASTGLTTITLPNSVTSIGSLAFNHCTRLTSITIGNSVSIIDTAAFAYCTGLNSVNIPNSVRIIGQCAFNECTGLSVVTIGNSVKYIGNSAFFNCRGLRRTNYTGSIAQWCGIKFEGFGNPIEYSHNLYINNTILTNLIIPNSVDTIKQYAFVGNTSLSAVTVPNSVVIIENCAFEDCYNLHSVTFNRTNTMLVGDCFRGVLGTYDSVYIPCGSYSWYNSQFALQYCSPNIIEDFPYLYSITSQNNMMGGVSTVTAPTCQNGFAWSVSATPNSSYTFSHWSDGNTQNPRTLTVTQDTMLIAYFVSNQGIAEAENDIISIRTANGHILLEGINGEQAYVTDVLGRVVYNATVNERAEIAVKNQGIYFVKIGSRPAQKVVVAR